MSTQLAFYFDQTKCGSCNACTVACKDWNQINPGPVKWRVQFAYEHDFGSGKRFFPLAYSCCHCDTPACKSACPAGAITKDPDNGIVTLHRELCQGYKSCISACPFAKPMIADDKQEPNAILGWQIQHPAQKCTMCTDRWLKNELKPTCTLSCIGRALDFGTVDHIQQTYGNEPGFTRLNPGDFPYAYINNKNNTGPNLYIKKMPNTGGQAGMKIHKSTIYTGKH